MGRTISDVVIGLGKEAWFDADNPEHMKIYDQVEALCEKAVDPEKKMKAKELCSQLRKLAEECSKLDIQKTPQEKSVNSKKKLEKIQEGRAKQETPNPYREI